MWDGEKEWAEMATDDPFLLRWLTRESCARARVRVRLRARTRTRTRTHVHARAVTQPQTGKAEFFLFI